MKRHREPTAPGARGRASGWRERRDHGEGGGAVLPIPLHRIGRWWDPQDEIDVVGVNDEPNTILFGEVTWSAKPVGTDILRALRVKASRVPWGRQRRREMFVLFSRHGFTPELRRAARADGVLLFREDRLPA